MGNMACVPQAPGRFRYSFSRKPSFKKEQESKKKLAGLFGFEAEQERDVTSDKILQYIPAKNFASQENGKENFDQRFPSLFKKGRRRTVVRNLGKIIHYSKLKFKFQHCQEASDCYLELFQEFLYFQSLGPNGHKYQGLVPLTELRVAKLENEHGIEEDLHAFQITGGFYKFYQHCSFTSKLKAASEEGPLLSPLTIYCPSQTELKHWLYHLEKQIDLNGGRPDLPLETQVHPSLASLCKRGYRWARRWAPNLGSRGREGEKGEKKEGKEGAREGRNEKKEGGRKSEKGEKKGKEGREEMRREGQGGREGGRKEGERGREGEKKEGRKEGRKEEGGRIGRKEGGTKEGKKEGRNSEEGEREEGKKE
ncbi:pleckstrin domain-containing family N member 1 [Crotalus adamanteus]|uniref:Pleckstrin domain-containing family N member 1 n=1 Tax=Crotalus adamanteus TaxID=8729 RepID=A0AAW1AR97_CROAD